MSTPSSTRKFNTKVLSGSVFNPSLRVETTNERLSSEVGVIALREIDDRLGLVAKLAASLYDPRDSRRVLHPLVELLRTRIFCIGQGFNDLDDCDKLRHEFSFRLGVSERTGDAPLRKSENLDDCGPSGLSSQPTQSRLMAALAEEINRNTMKGALLDWALIALSLGSSKDCGEYTADIDSSLHLVSGLQAGADYNGHYQSNGYKSHYVYLCEARAWVGGELALGSEYSSVGAEELLPPILNKIYEQTGILPYARGDSAYSTDELMTTLEQHKLPNGDKAPVSYCFKLKDNNVLQDLAAPYMHSPSGARPQKPRTWFHELAYKAENWESSRRVVLVVKEVPNELYHESFYLITSFKPTKKNSEEIYEYYRERGTMEADIGQLKSTLCPTLSSSDRSPLTTQEARTKEEQFAADQKVCFANEANLLINLLTYNFLIMGCNIMSSACPVMDEAQSGHKYDETRQHKVNPKKYSWSVKRFREQVLKCAGRFVIGSKKIRLKISNQCSELWQRFWKAIDLLPTTIE